MHNMADMPRQQVQVIDRSGAMHAWDRSIVRLRLLARSRGPMSSLIID